MGSRSIVYVGIYAMIYQHTILGERIVSRDGLPRGVLPSGAFWKSKNIVRALKFGPHTHATFNVRQLTLIESQAPDTIV